MGSCSISGDGEDSATPSPEGGQGENHLILFRRYPHCQRKSNSLSSEFSGLRADSVRRTASSLSPATHLASCQESEVGGRRASPRASSQSLQGLREFCEDESQRRAFCTIQPYSHSLHHCGYVDCAVGATCTVSGGVACAAQPVSLSHAHNSTRLRNSVRQVTSQVQPQPQPVGASGQLGKEQALPCAENLFSWCGVRLGEYDGAPHGRARPISAELPEFLQRQDCGSAKTVSEAPGAYGIRSCSHAARIASYETTSALVALPSPEVGMAPRCTSGEHHTGVSLLLQPLDGPCLSTGWGALRTSVSACCCHNRCLQHGLGRYMQHGLGR